MTLFFRKLGQTVADSTNQSQRVRQTVAESTNLAGFVTLPRRGALHRTGAPVLRDSLEAGTFEEAFFVPPSPGETDRTPGGAWASQRAQTAERSPRPKR